MSLYVKKWMQLAGYAALLLTASCAGNKDKEAETGNQPAVEVSLATPASADEKGIQVSGQVEAAHTANISTRVMGFITMLNVKVGDRVSKGQVLVTIKDQDLLARRAQADAMIEEAQASLQNAKKDLDRFTTLYNQQSATAKEVDNVTLQYSAARARLEAVKQQRNEATAMLGYTSLSAPFSGVVTQKLAEAGNIANPGMPLLTIEQGGSYQVSASVPENVISRVKESATADITINAVNKTIRGTVTQINQSSQFTGGQYIIKISIPDVEKTGLYAGMYANVSIPLAGTPPTATAENRIMVPASAIRHRDLLTGLFTVSSNNTALLRWVRTGKTYGDNVEILSGLGKNEKYVISANGELYNGTPVKIK